MRRYLRSNLPRSWWQIQGDQALWLATRAPSNDVLSATSSVAGHRPEPAPAALVKPGDGRTELPIEPIDHLTIHTSAGWVSAAVLESHSVQRIDHLLNRRCERWVGDLEAIDGGPELLLKRWMRSHGRQGGRLDQQRAGRLPHLRQDRVTGSRRRNTVKLGL